MRSTRFIIKTRGPVGSSWTTAATAARRRPSSGGRVSRIGRRPIKRSTNGDTLDPAAMAEVAHRTRVICTTVGPYSKYGAEVVAACAAAGTHYCDLAGEISFMRRMIDEHYERAKQTGARIVHGCGFDS